MHVCVFVRCTVLSVCVCVSGSSYYVFSLVSFAVACIAMHGCVVVVVVVLLHVVVVVVVVVVASCIVGLWPG